MKRKFNVIDGIAIVLLIIFITGIGYRVLRPESTIKEENGKCTFTVRVENIRKESTEAIIVGDTLSDGVDDVFGEINSVESKPYSEEILMANGQKVIAERPDKYVSYIDVTLEGEWKGDVFYYGEESVGEGGNFWVITKHVKTLGTVVSEPERV